MGINTAACALIGKHLGDQNIELAKKFMKGILLYSFFWMLFQTVLLLLLQNAMIDAFTADEQIKKIGHNLFPIFLLLSTVDFMQAVLSGVIRGLAAQRIFSLISFVSYYVIMVPLSYYLAFKVGSHFSDYSEVAIFGDLSQS
jgi:MATE family multidrug resistance protein